ncbi:AraC family transcriptional regulator [Pseudoflavitalea sp. G-6-1-2]|uniref:helix-turn-helix domain-containing protein n=1 Tax=Pseudoflavitalea sp. G-6-1-2 TaxID=2728841 RepID=UPI00146EEEC0|nr:AraC family transcriptional regulator [Pseudoflavitalea sp. G-6-1-2]NML20702.1 AraC family transcriptional regulator [Pseudoflavitalea sp. G-6-1-2]
MSSNSAYTLINQQNGHLAFKVFKVENNSHFDHIQRNNYFNLILITKGTGKVKSDFSENNFGSGTLLSFYPYQPFMISSEQMEGWVIQFHHDFFCIHRHHKEIGCHTILFNNVYQPPVVILNESSQATILMLIDQMIMEMKNGGKDHDEVIASYLKIMLINATRLKLQQHPEVEVAEADKKQLVVLQDLKSAIEANYRTKHTAGEYAALLNITPNALARIVKNRFNKTLSDLISERIIIEAKRELYLTNKPVKEIAWELGYEDEYYFSRFFKTHTDASPQLYRETVGFNRAEA